MPREGEDQKIRNKIKRTRNSECRRTDGRGASRRDGIRSSARGVVPAYTCGNRLLLPIVDAVMDKAYDNNAIRCCLASIED